MVKSYMKIVDTLVYDIVPKYIILGLVQEVIYVLKNTKPLKLSSLVAWFVRVLRSASCGGLSPGPTDFLREIVYD